MVLRVTDAAAAWHDSRVPNVAVLPGAEPIDLQGGRIGVLLSHGFTGSTQSMRPWGEHLHAAGLTVKAPRLPGHGTSEKDMNTTRWADWYGEVERAFDDLLARCDTVFAMGLSMGGTLVLRLAELRSEVAGLVIVNASLTTERKDAKLLPVLAKVVPVFKGIGSDIKKPGVTELAYAKTPLRAALSLQQEGWPVVRGDLARITCPVLAFRSREDHVVEPVSGKMLREGCVHAEEVVLEDSYHVATLDNDAPAIFEGSLDFVRKHTPA
jgi:carboxylesterase